MNEFVQMSPQLDELAKALNKAQSKLKPVSKDATNPYFKSKYADLNSIVESVRPVLSECGLSVVQLPSGGSQSGGVTLTTTLLHTSGQWISGSVTFYAKDSSAQAVGSCITYARRYALSALLNVASEDDDDGNHASKPSYAPADSRADLGSYEPAPGSAAYVVPFGKFKGKNLDQIDSQDIESYVKFLKTPKDGKPISGPGLEFIGQAQRYLRHSSRDQLDQGPLGNAPPEFNNADIPF